MKLLAKRLLKLEVGYAARTNDQGLTPADVFRQRICRRQAQETGRPYEELLQESVMEAKAFLNTYETARLLAFCGVATRSVGSNRQNIRMSR